MSNNKKKESGNRTTSRTAMRSAGLVLGLSLSLAGSLTALADEAIYIAVDGNQISEERRQDNVIEYKELGSLIHAYNADVQELVGNTEDSRQEYTEMVEYLRVERATASMKKGEAKDAGDMESYAEYAALESVYRSSIKNYNDTIKRLDKYSTNKGRLSLEKQLTSAAQSLMISYQSVQLQTEYLTKMEELSKTQYENARIQMQAGLATTQEVSEALNKWSEASINLNALVNNEQALYQSLCILLGVDESGSMVTAAIPSADPARITAMDLEADTVRAVGNNAELSTQRSNSGGSTAAKNKKTRTVDEIEEKLQANMQQLYEEVMQAKTTYDASQVGYSSAQLSWSNAQTKYSLGMYSRAEYLAAEMTYIQKKVEFEAADLSLFQTMETYDWAVNGVVTLF